MTMDDASAPLQDSERGYSTGPEYDVQPQVYPLAALTIRLATRAEITTVRKRSYACWGKDRMSLDQYLHQSAALDSTSASTEGKFNTWVLIPRDNPRRPFLASCETFRRESLLIRSGDAEACPAVSFGIASVFTPEKHRRNGYARHMLRLLHYVIARPSHLPPFPTDLFGAPPVIPRGYHFGEALFSVLYSDVGSHFYSSCGPTPDTPGWEVRDPWSVVWPVPDEPINLASARPLQWLGLDDLEGYLAVDRWRVMTEDLPDVAKAGPSNWATINNANTVHITTPPALPQISFLISRYIHARREPPPKNMHWGAAHTNASGEVSYMTWVPEPYEDSTLVISRVRSDDPTSFQILLSAAMHQAKLLGLKRVEVWNSLDCVESARDAAPHGGKWVERNAHLPAFAWYGEAQKKDVVWHLNERFAWC